jgi:hypothetical protein
MDKDTELDRNQPLHKRYAEKLIEILKSNKKPQQKEKDMVCLTIYELDVKNFKLEQENAILGGENNELHNEKHKLNKKINDLKRKNSNLNDRIKILEKNSSKSKKYSTIAAVIFIGFGIEYLAKTDFKSFLGWVFFITGIISQIISFRYKFKNKNKVN